MVSMKMVLLEVGFLGFVALASELKFEPVTRYSLASFFARTPRSLIIFYNPLQYNLVEEHPNLL